MLITLGIIGVVAAMTIPVLMTNIKVIQYTSRFKKSISTLSNAARMSQELYGFDYSGIDAKCSKSSASDNPDTKHTICALLNGTLQGITFYYGMDSLPDYKYDSATWSSRASFSDKNKTVIYSFADGTLFFIGTYTGMAACTRNVGSSISAGNSGDGYGNGCYGFLDVNGAAKPNKEVKCTRGTNKVLQREPGDCIVDKKDVNDIFPVVFYDGIVEPETSAAWYVYENLK